MPPSVPDTMALLIWRKFDVLRAGFPKVVTYGKECTTTAMQDRSVPPLRTHGESDASHHNPLSCFSNKWVITLSSLIFSLYIAL